MERAYQFIKEILVKLGLEEGSANKFEQIIKVLIIMAIVAVVGFILKMAFVFIKKMILAKFNFGNNSSKNVEKIIWRTIGILLLTLTFHLLPLALEHGTLLSLLLKADLIGIIICCISIINTLLTTGYETINRKDKYKQQPIKGFMQIIQIGIYFIGAIVIIATIMNKIVTPIATSVMQVIIFTISVIALCSFLKWLLNCLIR